MSRQLLQWLRGKTLNLCEGSGMQTLCMAFEPESNNREDFQATSGTDARPTLGVGSEAEGCLMCPEVDCHSLARCLNTCNVDKTSFEVWTSQD